MKILIAESDLSSLLALEEALVEWGYEVQVACDGAEAWAALQENDAPAIAVLDGTMRGLGGQDICRKMSEARGNRPYFILLMTRAERLHAEQHAANGAADDYLTRPFEAAELKARVQLGVRTLQLQRNLANRGRELEAARSVMLERERFDAAISAMGDGILTTDGNWRLLQANHAACLLLNLPPMEFAGLSLLEVLEAFTISPSQSALATGLERTTTIDIARQDTDPPLILAATLTRLFDSPNKMSGTVITVRDVTAERREQCARADFFTIMPHKLNTPLTVVNLCLYSLRRSFRDIPQHLREECQQMLDLSTDQIKQLQQMVHKMLQFKSLSLREMEFEARSTDLREAAMAARDALPNEGPQTHLVEMELDIAPQAAYVDANRQHVQFIFERLLSNAVKFNNHERVCIRVQARRRNAAWLDIRVSDNGPGIPHEYFDRIFHGFVQVEASVTGEVSGMGCGLFMTRQVVEAYGGSVTVSSRMGEGSTISFSLPSAQRRNSGPLERELAAATTVER